jgi:group I intron endonuclease
LFCVVLLFKFRYTEGHPPKLPVTKAPMARGIYKLINVINDKFYVGSAVDLKRRKTRHFSELRKGKHSNRHLQAAWNKYGEQAFVFVVIAEIPPEADLLAAENVWLHTHVGKDYCYNIGVDATAPMQGMAGELSPTWGYKHSAENIAVIAAASAGRVQDKDTIRRKTEHLIGKPKSAAVRAKISATLSGEGNFWYGKKRPDHGAKVRRAVQVWDSKGNTQTFPSIQTLREELKLKPPTVNRALKSGLPLTRGPLTGWSFKYVDTP